MALIFNAVAFRKCRNPNPSFCKPNIYCGPQIIGNHPDELGLPATLRRMLASDFNN